MSKPLLMSSLAMVMLAVAGPAQAEMKIDAERVSASADQDKGQDSRSDRRGGKKDGARNERRGGDRARAERPARDAMRSRSMEQPRGTSEVRREATDIRNDIRERARGESRRSGDDRPVVRRDRDEAQSRGDRSRSGDNQAQRDRSRIEDRIRDIREDSARQRDDRRDRESRDGRRDGYRDGYRDGRRDGYRGDRHRRWDRDHWRRDHRYDWRDYRHRNRSIFRIGFYYDPFGWNYRRYGIGNYMRSAYYRDNYWISDPWRYRLPPVYGPYRWVRYYDDALLVDIYNGQVVDVLYDFFW